MLSVTTLPFNLFSSIELTFSLTKIVNYFKCNVHISFIFENILFSYDLTAFRLLKEAYLVITSGVAAPHSNHLKPHQAYTLQAVADYVVHHWALQSQMAHQQSP